MHRSLCWPGTLQSTQWTDAGIGTVIPTPPIITSSGNTKTCWPWLRPPVSLHSLWCYSDIRQAGWWRCMRVSAPSMRDAARALKRGDADKALDGAQSGYEHRAED